MRKLVQHHMLNVQILADDVMLWLTELAIDSEPRGLLPFAGVLV